MADQPEPIKRRRGFQLMDAATHKAASAKGGRTVQERGIGARFRENDKGTQDAARKGAEVRHGKK